MTPDPAPLWAGLAVPAAVLLPQAFGALAPEWLFGAVGLACALAVTVAPVVWLVTRR